MNEGAMAQYHEAEAADRQTQRHVLDGAAQPVGGVSQHVVRHLRVGVVENLFHSQRWHYNNNRLAALGRVAMYTISDDDASFPNDEVVEATWRFGTVGRCDLDFLLPC